MKDNDNETKAGAMDMDEIEQWGWEAFATLHPHEAHETSPDRFWEFFQTKRPGVTRE